MGNTPAVTTEALDYAKKTLKELYPNPKGGYNKYLVALLENPNFVILEEKFQQVGATYNQDAVQVALEELLRNRQSNGVLI